METTDTIQTTSSRRWILPALGILAAIATNAVAQFGILNGLGAILLLPLLVIFWLIERFSRREMGFKLGRVRYYYIGLLQPVLVLGTIALLAWAAGAVNVANTNWSQALSDFALTVVLTILVTLITEDGFFRGWLWASLKRAGLQKYGIALVTGIAFGVWHLPYALFGAGYDPFSVQVPLLILSASNIGVAWGLLRLISGSVVVPSVVHGIWNGAAYAFFFNGAEAGALGIENITVFGPEAGLLGLALNLAYTIGLWMWYRRRTTAMRGDNLEVRQTAGVQSQDGI